MLLATQSGASISLHVMAKEKYEVKVLPSEKEDYWSLFQWHSERDKRRGRESCRQPIVALIHKVIDFLFLLPQRSVRENHDDCDFESQKISERKREISF